MKKQEVEQIVYDTTGFSRPKKNFSNDFKNGLPPEPSTAMTTVREAEVAQDEADQGDNNPNYCPSCGAKLR